MNFSFLIRVLDQYLDNAFDDLTVTRGFLEIKLKAWLDVSFAGDLISSNDYPYIKAYIKEALDNHFN